jgi:hypothetical protein
LLPAKIEAVDAQLGELHELVSKPEFYKQPPGEIAARQARLRELEKLQSEAYQRWEELDQLAE